MHLLGILVALLVVAFLTLGDLSAKKELTGKKQNAKHSEELDDGFDNVNTKNMHKLLNQVEKNTAQRTLYYDESLD